MEISQVIRDVRRNLAVALGVFILCVVVGGAAAFLPAKKYTASTEVAVVPSNNSNLNQNSAQIISIIAPQLPDLATSTGNLNAAQATVPEPYQSIGANVSATVDTGTFIVTISGTSHSPQAAADYVNAVANQLIKFEGTGKPYFLQIVSPAVPPTSPSNPRVPLVIGAGAFGVILGIFASLWAAGIRRRLSRVTEVKERIGATVLGEIPRVGAAGLRPSELFVKHTEPMAMEAFQELRSNLLISLPPGAPAAIAVTSCDPGEGKTSVATNIAWALATQDRHVTAIDCDLRKPALHTTMGVPFGPGVTSRRTEDALAHASHTPNPHLDVIPSGIIDRHPSDVVSAHLPLLLEELRQRHDTALVDCPPLIGVAETVLIAAMVDLIIVVVDARRFNPERLQQCLLRLDSTNANVAVVLNRVRFNRGRRDRTYGYGHFRHSAHSPSAAPAKMPPTITPRPQPGKVRAPRIETPRPAPPTVLRPPSAEEAPRPGSRSEQEKKDRSGYWQH